MGLWYFVQLIVSGLGFHAFIVYTFSKDSYLLWAARLGRWFGWERCREWGKNTSEGQRYINNRSSNNSVTDNLSRGGSSNRGNFVTYRTGATARFGINSLRSNKNVGSGWNVSNSLDKMGSADVLSPSTNEGMEQYMDDLRYTQDMFENQLGNVYEHGEVDEMNFLPDDDEEDTENVNHNPNPHTNITVVPPLAVDVGKTSHAKDVGKTNHTKDVGIPMPNDIPPPPSLSESESVAVAAPATGGLHNDVSHHPRKHKHVKEDIEAPSSVPDLPPPDSAAGIIMNLSQGDR
uniref:Uncharacterized protein n=1 Tax=Lygus hesperus TaxID=30085 RepID=A0A0A9Z2F9_LYGHE